MDMNQILPGIENQRWQSKFLTYMGLQDNEYKNIYLTSNNSNFQKLHKINKSIIIIIRTGLSKIWLNIHLSHDREMKNLSNLIYIK